MSPRSGIGAGPRLRRPGAGLPRCARHRGSHRRRSSCAATPSFESDGDRAPLAAYADDVRTGRLPARRRELPPLLRRQPRPSASTAAPAYDRPPAPDGRRVPGARRGGDHRVRVGRSNQEPIRPATVSLRGFGQVGRAVKDRDGEHEEGMHADHTPGASGTRADGGGGRALGGHDGMVFLFEEPEQAGFWIAARRSAVHRLLRPRRSVRVADRHEAVCRLADLSVVPPDRAVLVRHRGSHAAVFAGWVSARDRRFTSSAQSNVLRRRSKTGPFAHEVRWRGKLSYPLRMVDPTFTCDGGCWRWQGTMSKSGSAAGSRADASLDSSATKPELLSLVGPLPGEPCT